jgi:hypothetical protein
MGSEKAGQTGIVKSVVALGERFGVKSFAFISEIGDGAELIDDLGADRSRRGAAFAADTFGAVAPDDRTLDNFLGGFDGRLQFGCRRT